MRRKKLARRQICLCNMSFLRSWLPGLGCLAAHLATCQATCAESATGSVMLQTKNLSRILTPSKGLFNLELSNVVSDVPTSRFGVFAMNASIGLLILGCVLATYYLLSAVTAASLPPGQQSRLPTPNQQQRFASPRRPTPLLRDAPPRRTRPRHDDSPASSSSARGGVSRESSQEAATGRKDRADGVVLHTGRH
eukprot:TRINITY_DN94089_c0_g1_i1.p1 TRINITY_DN94089_c0_g1~~TRINITY_DN94089_c0_g1_i1.p1  ORF type:complete len:194 (+),score=7.96 TRINITY_DN94089_c0_g1_i1:78-659(+)